MGIIRGSIKHFQQLLQEGSSSELSSVDVTVEKLQAQIQSLVQECDTHKRIAQERLDVIYSIQRQRDEWQQLMAQEMREHTVAQGILEKHVVRARIVAARAIHLLNTHRKEHGLEPIKGDADLPSCDAAPVGTAESFARRMKQIYDSVVVKEVYKPTEPVPRSS